MDLVLEPHQRIVSWRQRIGRQRFNRVGHQNVKAAVGMIRMPGVQEHRKRQVAQTGKPELGGVCTPGKVITVGKRMFMYGILPGSVK